MKQVKMFLAILVNVLLVSCFDSKSVVNLKVVVLTNQGAPVTQAGVYLDDDLVGKTNYDGLLSKTIKLKQESVDTLEVRKDDSPEYYFARYYKKVKIGTEENTSVAVNATMYYVPKPSMGNTENIVDDEERTKKTEDDTVDKPDVEQQIAQQKITEEDKIVENKDKLSLQEEAKKEAKKNNATPLEQVVESESQVVHSYFTIHSFEHKKPLADTIIYISKSKGRSFKRLCITNKRGRCAFGKLNH